MENKNQLLTEMAEKTYSFRVRARQLLRAAAQEYPLLREDFLALSEVYDSFDELARIGYNVDNALLQENLDRVYDRADKATDRLEDFASKDGRIDEVMNQLDDIINEQYNFLTDYYSAEDIYLYMGIGEDEDQDLNDGELDFYFDFADVINKGRFDQMFNDAAAHTIMNSLPRVSSKVSQVNGRQVATFKRSY